MESPPITDSTEGQVDHDTERPYPRGLRFAIVMFAVCLIFITIGLDSTIIAIIVPNLTRKFGTIDDIGWYLSIYRLMSGSFQPMFGKLYSMLPAKGPVLCNLTIFFIGALITSFAPNSAVFILGRAITGLATAGVTSGAFAIIIELTPLRSRSKYASIGAATEASASLAAPLIGGAFVDHLSWRWCFYIELPLLVMAFICLQLFLGTPTRHLTAGLSSTAIWQALDPYSTATFVPAFTCLILALQFGGSKYNWSDWQVILPLGLFFCLLFAFGLLQNRLGERAILPPRIMRMRSVLFGFMFSACNNGSLSIIEYYMPIYFQIVQRKSATASGVLVLPTGIGLIISVPLAGFLTYYVGYPNPLMLLNGIVTPIATGLLTTVQMRPPTWKLLVYQAILGLGTGIGFQGPQILIQTILSDQDAQIGLAVIQLAQALGPASFVAAAQAVFAANTPSSLSLRGDDEDRALYSSALGKTFYLPLGLACLTLASSFGMRWRSVIRSSQG